jgi:hypothetical protein
VTKKQRFVIFDCPPLRQGPGTRYIANDGTSTDTRSKAANFTSHAEARAFAALKHITLSDNVYIGIEEFSDFEVDR